MLWRGTSDPKFYSRPNLVAILLLFIVDCGLSTLSFFNSECFTKGQFYPDDMYRVSNTRCGFDDLVLYTIFTIVSFFSKLTFLLSYCCYNGNGPNYVQIDTDEAAIDNGTEELVFKDNKKK